MNIAMLVASALTALAIVAHGPTASAQTRVPASPAKTGASSAGDVSQQQEPRQLAKSALQEAASKPRLLASFSASPNGFEDPTVLATDRQILLANRRTNHVAFWDFLEGRAVERLQAAQGMMVFSATLSPDESLLALGMNNKTVELWKVSPPARLAVLRGHKENLVDRLAFSPDGKSLATTGFDRQLFLWSVEKPDKPRLLDGKAGHVTQLMFNRSGTLLAAAIFSGAVRIWDPDDGELVAEGELDFDELYGLAFLNARDGDDYDDIAFAGSGGIVAVYGMESGKELRRVKAHKEIAYSVAISPDRKLLATGGKDQLVKLWNTADLSPVATLSGHSESVISVRFSRSGRLLASRGGGKTNEVKLWRIPEKR